MLEHQEYICRRAWVKTARRDGSGIMQRPRLDIQGVVEASVDGVLVYGSKDGRKTENSSKVSLSSESQVSSRAYSHSLQ